MVTLWSSPDSITIHLLEEFLKSRGIDVQVLGEGRASALGLLPITECWQDLVLLEAGRESEARDLVHAFFTAPGTEQSYWRCPECGENIGGKFTYCWKCVREGDSYLAESEDSLKRSRLQRYLRLLIATQVLLFLIRRVLDQYLELSSPLNSWMASRVMETNSFWNLREVYLSFYLLSALSLFGLLLSWNLARILFLGIWASGLVFFGTTQSPFLIAVLDTISIAVSTSILALVWKSGLREDFNRSLRTK